MKGWSSSSFVQSFARYRRREALHMCLPSCLPLKCLLRSTVTVMDLEWDQKWRALLYFLQTLDSLAITLLLLIKLLENSISVSLRTFHDQGMTSWMGVGDAHSNPSR